MDIFGGLPEPWIKQTTSFGNFVYYNPVTGETMPPNTTMGTLRQYATRAYQQPPQPNTIISNANTFRPESSLHPGAFNPFAPPRTSTPTPPIKQTPNSRPQPISSSESDFLTRIQAMSGLTVTSQPTSTHATIPSTHATIPSTHATIPSTHATLPSNFSLPTNTQKSVTSQLKQCKQNIKFDSNEGIVMWDVALNPNGICVPISARGYADGDCQSNVWDFLNIIPHERALQISNCIKAQGMNSAPTDEALIQMIKDTDKVNNNGPFNYNFQGQRKNASEFYDYVKGILGKNGTPHTAMVGVTWGNPPGVYDNQRHIFVAGMTEGMELIVWDNQQSIKAIGRAQIIEYLRTSSGSYGINTIWFLHRQGHGGKRNIHKRSNRRKRSYKRSYKRNSKRNSKRSSKRNSKRSSK
jgi:hypothetical protein